MREMLAKWIFNSDTFSTDMIKQHKKIAEQDKKIDRAETNILKLEQKVAQLKINNNLTEIIKSAQKPEEKIKRKRGRPRKNEIKF